MAMPRATGSSLSRPGDMTPPRLAAIVESSGEAIIASDLAGTITAWNPAAERIFAHKAGEMVGASILRLFPPESRDELNILERIGRGERIDGFETGGPNRDGRPTAVSISVRPIQDPGGPVLGISIIARDITELKAHERELARISRLYAALSQVNTAIVLTKDSGELCDKVCRALVEGGCFRMAWIGWQDLDTGRIVPVAQCGDDSGFLDGIEVYGDAQPVTEETAGNAFRASKPLVSNDLLSDPVSKAWRPALESRGFRSTAAFPITMRGVTRATLCVYADQPDFFHDREIALLQEAAGDVAFALDTMENDDERVRAASAVTSEKQFSDTMIESMPGIMYFYDGTRRFLRWNRNFETVSGYSGAEIAMMHPLDFFDARDASIVGERIAQVFKTGESSVEADFLAKDGTRTRYFFTGRHVAYNGRDCLVGVGIDISERKRAERALQELNETLEHKVAERTAELGSALARAEAADRIKSSFIASMSRELRTPLGDITGAADALAQGKSGPLTDEQARQLRTVQGSARHLLALIDSVLDLSS